EKPTEITLGADAVVSRLSVSPSSLGSVEESPLSAPGKPEPLEMEAVVVRCDKTIPEGAVSPVSVSVKTGQSSPVEVAQEGSAETWPTSPGPVTPHTSAVTPLPAGALAQPLAGLDAGAPSPAQSLFLLARSPASTSTGNLQTVPELLPTKEVAWTPFSRNLAAVTATAPDRLAEKLIERLQQCCHDEASLGNNSYVWDTQLPGGRRFSDHVARALATQLQALGFTRIEWWSGKEWKDMPGRYCIFHDHMYDKFTMRIRVHWPEKSRGPSAKTEPNLSSQGKRLSQQDASLMSMLQQMRQ
ncbi:unnamed protein product, partial [Polarella glacialis]